MRRAGDVPRLGYAPRSLVDIACLLGHRAWKCVAQFFDHLEERRIDVGIRVGDENTAVVALQYYSVTGAGLEKLRNLYLFR